MKINQNSRAGQLWQSAVNAVSGARAKGKKPFYLRWWFILLAAVMVLGVGSCADCGCSGCAGEKIVWEDMILGDKLPEPPENRGEIHYNSWESLHIDVSGLTDRQYADYVEACRAEGYTADADTLPSSYTAFSQEGYKLSLSYYRSDGELSLRLEKPMELGEISWPEGTAGSRLPAPESTAGKFSYEHDDSFAVYVGGTSRESFAEYVNACAEKGFTVDYSKGEDYYYADDSEGWHLSLSYEGGGIMSVTISPPGEEPEQVQTPDDSAVSTEGEKNTPTESKPTESAPAEDNSDGMDPDFKAAMDSYEKFMDDYIAFMKKYNQSGGTDLGLMTDYARYLSDYSRFCKDFEKWEEEDLNKAELAYYIDVQNRVSRKLLEVAY